MKNIFFIGRLEEEKGIDIVFRCIEESVKNHLPHHYHIFGDGPVWAEIFAKYDKRWVTFYGHRPHEEVMQHLKKADFLLMPSRFLETFWLSALEAVSAGIPVIGFRKWGLENFILPEHALRENSPVSDFHKILQNPKKSLPEIKKFSYRDWKNTLESITDDCDKILLIHDFSVNIGGAEGYVENLAEELELLGKTVIRFWYEKNPSKWQKIWLFLGAFFDFRRTKKITEMINFHRPDLIWSHSVLRYIGPMGMAAIKKSYVPHIMMHHDLGLVSVRPSLVEKTEDIPKSSLFFDWVMGAKNIFSAWIKWLMIWVIWRKIPKNTKHFVPSDWMVPIFEKYSSRRVEVFSHTLFWKNKK